MQIWHIDFLPLSNSKFVCDSELLPVVFAQGIAYMLKINVLSIAAIASSHLFIGWRFTVRAYVVTYYVEVVKLELVVVTKVIVIDKWFYRA